MKAPDICERWMWENPEQIIERLLAASSRTIGLPAVSPMQRKPKDHYYTQARRCAVRQAMRKSR